VTSVVFGQTEDRKASKTLVWETIHLTVAMVIRAITGFSHKVVSCGFASVQFNYATVSKPS
jgi:hypothetical protein